MKRLLVALLLVAGLVLVPAVGSISVHADTSTSPNCTNGGPGAQTCTVHGTFPIDFGPACGLADVVLQGNGVLHYTINKAGDSWTTGTVEGSVTGFDAGGNAVFSGHGQAWFGDENNLQNGVQHFTANFNGTLADGTQLGGHINGQFAMNANGQITVMNVHFFCRT